MKYHNELRGKPRTLPRLGSRVRIPSPAPRKPTITAELFALTAGMPSYAIWRKQGGSKGM